MSEQDDHATKISCCSRVGRVENLICSTGNAWGYLDGKPASLWGLWWFGRHLIYFAVAAILLVYVPGSDLVVIPFILLAHLYKGVRVAIINVRSEREKRRTKQLAYLREGKEKKKHSSNKELADVEAQSGDNIESLHAPIEADRSSADGKIMGQT